MIVRFDHRGDCGTRYRYGNRGLYRARIRGRCRRASPIDRYPQRDRTLRTRLPGTARGRRRRSGAGAWFFRCRTGSVFRAVDGPGRVRLREQPGSKTKLTVWRISGSQPRDRSPWKRERPDGAYSDLAAGHPRIVTLAQTVALFDRMGNPRCRSLELGPDR